MHRTRRLDPRDVFVLRGVRVTTAARTLVDLADVLDQRRLARALHEAEVLCLLDLGAIDAARARAPGRHGAPRLIAALVAPPDPTPDEFSRAFMALCDRHGLPAPRVHVHLEVDGVLRQMDGLFAAERVIVELDGERTHRTRRKFHADRQRDTRLAAMGYLTVRVTRRRIVDAPAEVAEDLRAILRLRAAGRGPVED